MYFCGAQMVDTTGLGPVLDGMALNNGIGSYGGRVTFCFTADRDALPDPEFYEACLAGAVDELLEVAKQTTGAPTTKAKVATKAKATTREGLEGKGPPPLDQGRLTQSSSRSASRSSDHPAAAERSSPS